MTMTGMRMKIQKTNKKEVDVVRPSEAFEVAPAALLNLSYLSHVGSLESLGRTDGTTGCTRAAQHWLLLPASW